MTCASGSAARTSDASPSSLLMRFIARRFAGDKTDVVRVRTTTRRGSYCFPPSASSPVGLCSRYLSGCARKRRVVAVWCSGRPPRRLGVRSERLIESGASMMRRTHPSAASAQRSSQEYTTCGSRSTMPSLNRSCPDHPVPLVRSMASICSIPTSRSFASSVANQNVCCPTCSRWKPVDRVRSTGASARGPATGNSRPSRRMSIPWVNATSTITGAAGSVVTS